jgi:hypothetical protein
MILAGAAAFASVIIVALGIWLKGPHVHHSRRAIYRSSNYPNFDSRSRATRRLILKRLSMALTVYVLTIVTSFLTFGGIYKQGAKSIFLVANPDMSSYAVYSQHLLDAGFTPSGQVVGANLGTGVQGLGFGACAIIANLAALLGTNALNVLYVALLMALFLGTYSSVRFLTERLNVALPLAILAAVSGFAVFFVVYLENNYFLSQLVAIALLPAFLTVLFDSGSSLSVRDWFAATIAAAVLAAIGIATYPQMVFVAAAIFVPAVALSRGFSGAIRRGGLSTVSLLIGLAGGAAIVPSLTRTAWRLVHSLQNVHAGWPLPGILVSGVLGFQTSPRPHNSAGQWTASVILLACLLASGCLTWRFKGKQVLTSFVILASASILACYAVVFLHLGVSYQQWKWITYFTPLFVALFVAQVLTAIDSLGKNLPASAVGVTYLLCCLALSSPVTIPIDQPMASSLVNMEALPANPTIRSLRGLNVDLGPSYWYNNWSVYFFRDKRLYLQGLAYFPAARPRAYWTLVPNSTATKGKDVIPLDSTYRLVHK